MRCGTVPVGISLSCTDKASVTHIYRDKEFFAFLCGNCAFAEYHVFSIYIIMNRCETFKDVYSHTLDYFVHHCLTVEDGKFLNDFHIMDILFKEFALCIGEMFRNVRILCILDFFDFGLDLFVSAFRFHLCDEFINIFL